MINDQINQKIGNFDFDNFFLITLTCYRDDGTVTRLDALPNKQKITNLTRRLSQDIKIEVKSVLDIYFTIFTLQNEILIFSTGHV